MALAAGAHTTLAIPLSSSSRVNANSTSSPWASSLILSVPSLHYGGMKACISATELSGTTWFAEQSIWLCTDNASMPVTGSFRIRVSSEPNSSIVSGKGLRIKFVSRSGNGIEGKRFDSLRPHAKPRFQTQQQQPRTDDDQQRPPPEPIGKLEPSMERYLQYLSDYKIVYDTMEEIVRQAPHPSYAIFWNSGLERSAALAKDFEWLRSQGHTIPQPNTLGRTYAQRLKYLSENDPPAFIYSVYNVFYAHSAGGRYIGRKT
ncbi:hypothetical protein O6H91_14G003800 [Diphasiastrum complanatum]|uniref:Uncharacterized protein n=1 Tax=Diphasiastrum complanatum TaxID=34168 RepID=A0ACC2BL74_DIPCM|nr:hypothetical protein O6H91_14G003800 [Diphasiastrum complanatum]